MSSGKVVLIFILSQIACNGWWFCLTQDVDIVNTPVLLPPILATIGLLGFLGEWLVDEW